MRIESTCHCSCVVLMKDMKRTLRFEAYQNIRNLMNPLAFALQKRLVHLTKILSSAKSRIQVLGYLVNCPGNRYPSTGSFLIKKILSGPILYLQSSETPQSQSHANGRPLNGMRGVMLQLFHVNRWVGNWNLLPATQRKNMAPICWKKTNLAPKKTLQRSKYGSFMVRSLDVWCTDAPVQTCNFGNPFNRFGQKPLGTQFSSLNKGKKWWEPQKNYAYITPSRPPFAAMVPLQTTADPTAQRETNRSQTETGDKIKFLPLATSSIVFQKGSSMTMTFLGVHRNVEQMLEGLRYSSTLFLGFFRHVFLAKLRQASLVFTINTCATSPQDLSHWVSYWFFFKKMFSQNGFVFPNVTPWTWWITWGLVYNCDCC